jgi:acid phosphatase class B
VTTSRPSFVSRATTSTSSPTSIKRTILPARPIEWRASVSTVFYGDSDSDITDAKKVQTKSIRPIRFLRSPKSSNRKEGRLNQYHPGYYGESIIADSYE